MPKSRMRLPTGDTRADSSEAYRVAYWVLLFFTVVVAVVTFLLSFSGLDDYGRHVARLGRLSPLVPLGVDGLTLCAVAATFILRRAPFQIRLYAWCVFAIAVAASVAGNVSHAAARHLLWDGMIGAAAWPILLALASHLAIVTRRAIERPGTVVNVAPPTPHRPPAARLDARATPQHRVAIPATPVAQTRPRLATTTDDRRAEARRRYLDGESCSSIAQSLRCDRKTIERYTADLRQARAAATARREPQPQTRDLTSVHDQA